MRLFVDGVERASDMIDTGWVVPGNTVYLGGHTGNVRGNGIWDEVRIFNRALSAEEVEPFAHRPSYGTIMRIQ